MGDITVIAGRCYDSGGNASLAPDKNTDTARYDPGGNVCGGAGGTHDFFTCGLCYDPRGTAFLALRENEDTTAYDPGEEVLLPGYAMILERIFWGWFDWEVAYVHSLFEGTDI